MADHNREELIVREDSERVVSVLASATGAVNLTIDIPRGGEDCPGVFVVLKRDEARALHVWLTDYLNGDEGV